jgi:hypothetical protein
LRLGVLLPQLAVRESIEAEVAGDGSATAPRQLLRRHVEEARRQLTRTFL